MEKIIVFGMGKYFECKRGNILKNYEVSCFLDNKIQMGEKCYFEDTSIEIINPSQLDKNDTTKIFLMSVHFLDMWKQLVALGIDSCRIVFPYFQEPFFENDDELVSFVDDITFYAENFKCTLKSGEVVFISNQEEWRGLLRDAYRNRHLLINAVADMKTEPISKQFGTERGTPIDRYYIGEFLAECKEYICGDVLEIEDSTYTYEYGGERVKNAIVMDVSSEAGQVDFIANLETGEGIKESIADCFILTQTLMYIFDIKTAAKNIAKLLKQNGVALITCSGISQNSRRCMDNYGCYFNFNKDVFVKMFENEANMKVIKAGSYGNVKTVSAHINGVCCEDLDEKDFIPNDKYYPLIVYAVVRKSDE